MTERNVLWAHEVSKRSVLTISFTGRRALVKFVAWAQGVLSIRVTLHILELRREQ